tara:strand:+ start:2418 stop:2639 length:222 start_codon:yes stop_codon:yes gene_type:complete
MKLENKEVCEIVFAYNRDFNRTTNINDYLNGAKANDNTFTMYCERDTADKTVEKLVAEGVVIISQKNVVKELY